MLKGNIFLFQNVKYKKNYNDINIK